MCIRDSSHVYKQFGNTKVIKDLSFSVSEHHVFGFIGKNGAGKTTTMKMILGFLKMDGGEICVCGERVTAGSPKACLLYTSLACSFILNRYLKIYFPLLAILSPIF